MILKIVTLFLVFMMGLGLFGRLKWPGSGLGGRPKKCAECGRFRVGGGECDCRGRV